MQFTFLDMAGHTLFVREDAERAQWTQEEMSLDVEFPLLDDKRITTGQRIFFVDPYGNHQVYEVKQAKTAQPDAFQNVVAEHIVISELSDEHLDNKEITNVSASNALQGVLSGTLWRVGNVKVNPTSSVDISRGSVWQAVLQIKDNWNVYIEPRVVLSSDGSIARYLDILSTDGEWNGLRLSIDKNMLDPSVTYDDSETATALYGYGGTTTPTQQGEEQEQITFKDIAWAKTSDHPAKPAGQMYLEDPDATRLYGRNGRPRFAFYQNNDITDPLLLLQKTWETLKTCNKPAISVEGTVADLYRLGYADQPIKLHDIALVEVLPSGYKDRIQIIRCTVDLLDGSATTVTIGAYIPNIIYIERKNNENATGGRGGGGGNKSSETVRSEYETEIAKNNRMIMLRAYQNDLDELDNEVKRQDARITIEANRITAEVTAREIADGQVLNEATSRIQQTAREIRLEVDDKTSAASIVAGINSQSGSYVKISAATINLSGYVTASQLKATQADIDNLKSGQTTAVKLRCQTLEVVSGYAFKYGGSQINKRTITIGEEEYKLLTWS